MFALDNERELIVHLGMTGVVRLRSDASIDPYVRASWTFDDGTILELRDVRQFGRVAAVTAGDYRTLPTLHALGPDPFDPAFTSREFFKALRKSNQRVKTQLLSQRPIAGVGNIYADEALWRARVHPATRRVSQARADALLAALRAVLAQGIDNGGTTLRDYRTSPVRRAAISTHSTATAVTDNHAVAVAPRWFAVSTTAAGPRSVRFVSACNVPQAGPERPFRADTGSAQQVSTKGGAWTTPRRPSSTTGFDHQSARRARQTAPAMP